MVALPPRQGLNLPIAQLVAAVTAGLALLAIAIAPSELIERVVMASGLPAILPAAAPPLGLTARLALLFAAGCGVAGIVWLATHLAVGPRALRFGGMREVDAFDVPAIRRADAHPDAPGRAPVLATRDLGEPFAAEEEVPLPVDLDTPLAAYDPGAVRPIPLRIDRPVPVPLGRAERIETFELTPASRPAPVAPQPVDIGPIAAPETEATIHALLARLERGVERRRRSPAPPQLHAALDSLRHAVRA